MQNVGRDRITLSQSPGKGVIQRDGSMISPHKASEYGEIPIRSTPVKEQDRIFTYGKALSSALGPVLSSTKKHSNSITPNDYAQVKDEGNSIDGDRVSSTNPGNQRGSLVSIEQLGDMRSRYH